LWRKIALNSARSRSLILRARFFKLGSPGIVPVFGPGVPGTARRGTCEVE
jgi:hypothetical protein